MKFLHLRVRGTAILRSKELWEFQENDFSENLQNSTETQKISESALSNTMRTVVLLWKIIIES